MCVVWHDKRDVRVISFISQPCRVKGRVQEIECPESVVQYNKHMGELTWQIRTGLTIVLAVTPKSFGNNCYGTHSIQPLLIAIFF